MVFRRFIEDMDKVAPTMKIFLVKILQRNPANRYSARELNTSAKFLGGYAEQGYPNGARELSDHAFANSTR